MQEETLFHLALEQPAAERAAFLDKMCGDDRALRQRVEALLQAHDNPGGFLARPALPEEPTVDEPRVGEGPGSRIGPYKLLQQIGEGGMGTVFMAEQTEPVRRRVALKVIKPGMDTRQVTARFEAERQALAMMDHPNIAKVFDAGTTDSGRPYFVMELVKGVPLTKYCDEHRLTPRQRLELFIPVCQAVQHAHQKGIIHRDLKPSNVLIALYDGKPVPKVIDFGVAKAVGGGLTDKTLFTDFGAVVGTLEYMSPEQAEPNQLDIDTRSDLYALGVLLYELLTGTTPFERKRLRAAALLECLRIIREEEPQKPSTRLSTAQQSPSIAANRGLEPKKLTGVVRGDLDWIVMKCLEKDRNRRYETANGLVMDVQRYLADEPVLASPPSPLYRLRKFGRRHKAQLLTAAVVVAVLSAGAGSVGWALWDRAKQQAVHDAERSIQAQQNRENAKALLARLDELYKQFLWNEAEAMLERAEALVGADADADLNERIDRAKRKTQLFRGLDDARLTRLTISEGRQFNYAGAAAEYAKAFAAYGLDVQPGRAEALARRMRAEELAVRDALVVGLDDWAMCERTAFVAELRALAGAADADPWRQEYRRAAADKDGAALARLSGEARRQSLPPTSLLLLANTLRDNDRREEAVALLRWARKDHPTDFWVQFDLGTLLEGDGERTSSLDLEEAVGCFRAALALRPRATAVYNNLGKALGSKERWDDAIAEFNRAIALNPKFALAHANLGIALKAKGQWDDAIAEFKQAIELDPNLATAHNSLGITHYDKKQWDDAIAEFQRAIDLDPRRVEPHHNMGNALKAKRRLDDAIAEYQRAVDLDPKDARVHASLGLALADKNQLDDAIAEYRKAIDLDPNYAAGHCNLGTALIAKNQWDEAIGVYKRAIDLNPKLEPAHYGLGLALAAKNQWNDAIAEFNKAIALDPKHAFAHYKLGIALMAKNQVDEAIAAYRKAIELDTKFAAAHKDLGWAFWTKKQVDQAIAEYRTAIELDAKFALPHNDLGLALAFKNQVNEAIVEYEKAIELDPKNATFYFNLIPALMSTARITEAREYVERLLKLLPENDPSRPLALQQREQCDRLVALEARLPGLLAGTVPPADNRERLDLAQLCTSQRRNAAAARWYGDAFAADAKVADDLKAWRRYNAACCAALAAAGVGTDADKLEDKERERLRKQALDWLRADLGLWRKQRETGKPQDRTAVQETLRHWQEDADLASLRDKGAVAKLPAEEREACQRLWADVAELLKKADDAK